MSNKKEIYLSEFMPKSELILDEHLTPVPKYEVIDIHAHYRYACREEMINGGMKKEVERLKSYGIKKIINLDHFWGDDLDFAMEISKGHEDFFLHFCGVDVNRLNDENYREFVEKSLKESKKKGVKGIKFFKELSLSPINGTYIAADDIRLIPIWETAGELNLPVLIHIGDPTAFFKPVDYHNERYEELTRFDCTYYQKTKFTFQELMDQLENLLFQNKETTFIIPHVGCYPENIKQVSIWLDTYPNMYVDIAARLGELGRQPYTSKKFFEQYSDRILFGTDAFPGTVHWPIYYRFLETMDEYFEYSNEITPPQGRWSIYGIGLDDIILRKIYYENAERIIKI